MPNYVNVLDVLNYSVLNGGSNQLTDEDVWFWDYHLTKPHVNSNISFVPRYAINQIDADPNFGDINTTAVTAENLFSPSNSYYMTSDYLKGTFIFSKTTKNLYYLDIPTKVVQVLPKTGVIPTTIEGTTVKGKLLEYRAASQWLLYADTADQVLYKYDVSQTTWSALSSFPTGWNINSTTSEEVTLLVDQVTNDIYMMVRNLYVVSSANKTIYYNYRVFKFDVTAGVFVEVIHETSFDLYNYGINQAEPQHTPGRCMIHNNKLFIFQIFNEVFPSGTTGRDTFLSFIVVNLTNGAVEKNDWLPLYNQSVTYSQPVQAVRYGAYMALITPDTPALSFLIDPITYNISFLRLALGSAQGTNVIRTGSNYAISAVPSSNFIYDPRERKVFPISWMQSELVADYSFDDQIYTDSILINCNSTSGINVYIDTGTGSFTAVTNPNYNAQSKIYTCPVQTYLKRFRISYAVSSANYAAELYGIQVMADPTHIWILNAVDNRLDNDQFNNIVVGTPTAARLYKVQNKTGYTTTAVRVYIEANGDTGSYFTEVSSQQDTGFVRHCTANSGSACTKGFSFGTRACASGRCGGYEKTILSPSPQALPPNQSAIFYVRVNVPTGQTRINRAARVICQLEY